MSVYPVGADIVRDALLSDDGLYRYRLRRVWGTGPYLPFIMLNPSTADATVDDPTIRRCVGFAREHGFVGITVANLYAFRTSKPKVLWEAEKGGTDIVGPDNNDHLSTLFEHAANVGAPVVAAWGAGATSDRAATVRAMGTNVLHHLGLTANGSPRHPLYVKSDTPLTPWSPA